MGASLKIHVDNNIFPIMCSLWAIAGAWNQTPAHIMITADIFTVSAN